MDDALLIGPASCTEEEPLNEIEPLGQVFLKPVTPRLFQGVPLVRPVGQPVALLFHRQANRGERAYHVTLLDVVELSQNANLPLSVAYGFSDGNARLGASI